MATATKRKVRSVEEVLADQRGQAENAAAKALVPVKANTLTVVEGNPWLEAGSAIDKFIGAPLLKFNKQGEFAYSDIDNVADGTRAVAHADEVMLGWQKWADGRPESKIAGRVADSFCPPQRDTLGDTDPMQWEIQEGVRRDPWQFFMSCPITVIETGETYNFTTGSKGGLNCLGKLVRAYGKRVQSEKVPGLPIVLLRAGHYKHQRYGKIFFPVLEVVEWTGADGKPLSIAEDMNDSLEGV